jgi:hypothetical protein
MLFPCRALLNVSKVKFIKEKHEFKVKQKPVFEIVEAKKRISLGSEVSSL